MQKYLKILFTLSFSTILLLGFTETANMVTGNWYQQFMPNIGSEQIADITFTDSLTGYAVTQTHYILKTTNGGDNWTVIYNDTTGLIFTRMQFLNSNTGYVAGVNLMKTTNGGNNWVTINSGIFIQDFHFLNVDTAWYVDPEGLAGGVFRTTNGGVSWQQQAAFSQNPEKIYMFNARIGFISSVNSGAPYTRKTTNSGQNWFIVTNGSGEGFNDMFFTDSLTGWGSFYNVRRTTNGGINWTAQVLPFGGIILTTQILKFSNINKDTIWGVGGEAFYGAGQFRGILYRTTNGGTTWLFQIPDTTIHLGMYYYITFINKNTGWAYATFPSGIHTTVGGDTTFLTGIKQISSSVPKDFKLFQNYPNPFNPKTVIGYELKVKKFVKLKVFDIIGKEVITLVNQTQSAGTYQVDFSGNGYSSGVYFYQMTVDDKVVDTKKMILLK